MADRLALKVMRTRYRYTQDDMAQKLGISRQMYSRIEKGQSDGTIQFWGKIQRIFELTGEEMWHLIYDKAPAEV